MSSRTLWFGRAGAVVVLQRAAPAVPRGTAGLGIAIAVAMSLVLGIVGPAGAIESSTVEAVPTVESIEPSKLAPLESPAAVPVTGDVPAGDFQPPEIVLDPAPADQSDAVPVDGFDPETSAVVSRDEFQQVYRNADGTFTTQLSQEPLNVASSAGKWEPVSTTVTATADGGGQVVKHPLKPRFAGQADDPALLTVSRGGADVQVALVGASDEPAQRSEDGVSYADVLADADLTYEVTRGAIKEAVVLERAPQAPRSYSWRITGSDFTIVEGHSGSFDIVSGGKVAMTIPPALMVDSSGQEGLSGPAEVNAPMTVTRSGAGWLLTVTPDHEWLTDPARVYPVSVDPTIAAGNDDMWAYRSDGVAVHGAVRIGNARAAGDTHWRTVVHYNYEQFFGQQVLDAQLYAVVHAGTANSYAASTRSATNFSYTGAGELLSMTAISDSAWFSGDTGMSNRFAQWVRDRARGAYLMLGGHEAAGLYTYKDMDTALYVTTAAFPIPGGLAAPSPGNGARGGVTPTLAVTDPVNSGTTQWNFKVSTNPNVDAAPLWSSGWIGQKSVEVPPRTLAQGTTYYWKADVRNDDDGLWGTSTQRASATWSFVTNSITQAPQATATLQGEPVSITGSPMITDLTPTMTGTTVTDPNGDALQYRIQVASGADGATGTVAASGWLPTPTFTVPEGSLQDGGAYTWTILTKDAYDISLVPWVGRFTVNRRLAESGPSPVETVGPVTVNLANGNAGLRFTSPTLSTVGGDIGMVFSYNSQQVRPRGLAAKYYDATPTAGQAPNFTFTGREPVTTRVDPQLNFSWGMGSPAPAVPAENFLARWTGYVTPPAGTAGSWTFGVAQDDGARVYVGNTKVLDRWSTQAGGPNWGSAVPVSGPTPITVEFFEQSGAATFQLWARLPDGTQVIVPSSWLSPTVDALPSGWTSSTPLAGDAGDYATATVETNAVILTDVTGTAHTYIRTSAGGYTPPAGEYGVLALSTTGQVNLTEEDGTVYVFGANGRLESATPPADALKPATPRTTYRPGTGQPDAVTDPVSGKAVRFFYPGDTAPTGLTTNNGAQACLTPATELGLTTAPAGMICRIVYPGPTAGSFGDSTVLGYDPSGRLVRITDPGNEVTDLAYAANSELTAIRTPLIADWLAADTTRTPGAANLIQFAYTGDKVTTVTLPAADGATTTGRLATTFAYETGATHVDRTGITATTTGHARTVTFDDSLRQLTDTTSTGLTATQTWNTKDQVLSATDPAGRMTTTIYDQRDRATDSYGPAPAACFGADRQPLATCPIVPARTSTGYDEAMQGLNVTYYPNDRLTGQPTAFALGFGGTSDGALARDGT